MLKPELSPGNQALDSFLFASPHFFLNTASLPDKFGWIFCCIELPHLLVPSPSTSLKTSTFRIGPPSNGNCQIHTNLIPSPGPHPITVNLLTCHLGMFYSFLDCGPPQFNCGMTPLYTYTSGGLHKTAFFSQAYNPHNPLLREGPSLPR